MADNPITRKEKYLAKLTGSYAGNVPDPITRVEKYLYDLCQKGVSGLTPEEIENAVNKYLKENPVQPGATTEQAAQIEQNKVDIASLKTETSSLKEDISTKITKFYASSQGETHITDSDNGKIQDMMIYGKSSQDGTPTPENPVEIKSVVNPTVKVCGKNLFDKNNCYDNKWIKDLQGNSGINNDAFTTNHIFVKKGATVAIRKTGTSRRGYFNISKTKFTYTESTNTTFTAIEDCWLMVSCNKATTPIEDFQIELGSTPTAYEPYHEQTVTLPYTLNAIPVETGGNVTIDGQQYIADYVDVERGKLVKKIKEISKDPIVLVQPTNNPSKKRFILGNKFLKAADNFNKWSCKCSNLQTLGVGMSASYGCVESCGIDTGGNLYVYYEETSEFTTAEEFKAWWGKRDIQLMGILETPIEIDLTSEEIAAFKALVTYYPTTNISVNSEQLDGYTVFNYPISMANGWNYVKQQIGDTRDYIYDMGAKTQDIDMQAAEAYVNSEYAIALTELEV